MPVNIDVVVDTHGLEQKLQQKSSQLQSKIRQMQRLMLTDAQREVQREAPRKTGRLKGAVQYSMGSNVGQIFVNKGMAPYVDWVIDGRKGFCVKNKKALRFVIQGKTIFRKCVGPAKPNPFFDKSVPQVERHIETRLNAFTKWLEE
jgi:hypothetical protein